MVIFKKNTFLPLLDLRISQFILNYHSYSTPKHTLMKNLINKPLFWIILLVVVLGLVKVILTMLTVANVMD